MGMFFLALVVIAVLISISALQQKKNDPEGFERRTERQKKINAAGLKVAGHLVKNILKM